MATVQEGLLLARLTTSSYLASFTSGRDRIQCTLDLRFAQGLVLIVLWVLAACIRKRRLPRPRPRPRRARLIAIAARRYPNADACCDCFEFVCLSLL